jgi:hypothetical protein
MVWGAGIIPDFARLPGPDWRPRPRQPIRPGGSDPRDVRAIAANALRVPPDPAANPWIEVTGILAV